MQNNQCWFTDEHEKEKKTVNLKGEHQTTMTNMEMTNFLPDEKHNISSHAIKNKSSISFLFYDTMKNEKINTGINVHYSAAHNRHLKKA